MGSQQLGSSQVQPTPLGPRITASPSCISPEINWMLIVSSDSKRIPLFCQPSSAETSWITGSTNGTAGTRMPPEPNETRRVTNRVITTTKTMRTINRLSVLNDLLIFLLQENHFTTASRYRSAGTREVRCPA